MRLKTVTVPRGYEGLHLEVPGAIINVYTTLTNKDGRRVTRVSIDCDHYAGQPPWFANSRVTRQGAGVLIVEQTRTESKGRTP